MYDCPLTARGQKRASSSTGVEARSEAESIDSAGGGTSQKASGAGRAAVGPPFSAVPTCRSETTQPVDF